MKEEEQTRAVADGRTDSTRHHKLIPRPRRKSKCHRIRARGSVENGWEQEGRDLRDERCAFNPMHRGAPLHVTNNDEVDKLELGK